MIQLTKVKQNIHEHKDESCIPQKNTKKLTAQPSCVTCMCFVNCAHWRGSTSTIWNSSDNIFPLNLQTITITLDIVKWRGGGVQFGSSHTNTTNINTLVGFRPRASSTLDANAEQHSTRDRRVVCYAFRVNCGLNGH